MKSNLRRETCKLSKNNFKKLLHEPQSFASLLSLLLADVIKRKFYILSQGKVEEYQMQKIVGHWMNECFVICSSLWVDFESVWLKGKSFPLCAVWDQRHISTQCVHRWLLIFAFLFCLRQLSFSAFRNVSTLKLFDCFSFRSPMQKYKSPMFAFFPFIVIVFALELFRPFHNANTLFTKRIAEFILGIKTYLRRFLWNI